MSEFRDFQKFQDIDEANDFAKRLLELGIVSEIEEPSGWLDSSIMGEVANTGIRLKLRPEDFDKVNALIEREANALLDAIDEDYYLFEFSDDELYEILLQRESWSELDAQLAQKILAERGKEVDSNLVEALRKQRFDELAKTEESPRIWIIAGYVIALVGGFLGSFIGWYLWKSTKTIPDGRKVYRYKKADRDHGLRIFALGIIILIGIILLRITASYNSHYPYR